LKGATLLVLAVALVIPAGGRAKTPIPVSFVVAPPNANGFPGGANYVPTLITLTEGSSLTFFNLDPLEPGHTLTLILNNSVTAGTLANLVPFGQARVVTGIQNLLQGSYAFFCLVHSTSMVGILDIVRTT
jgi:plastocyanin